MGLESSSSHRPSAPSSSAHRALRLCCPPNCVLPPAELGCRPTGRPPPSAARVLDHRPSQPLRVAAPADVKDNDVLAHRSFRGLCTTRAICRAFIALAPFLCSLPRAAYRESNASFGPARKKRRDLAERPRDAHILGEPMHPRLRPFPSRRALLCQTSSALASNDGAQAHCNDVALLSVSQLRLPLAREQKNPR
jgi:hypothetical protein